MDTQLSKSIIYIKEYCYKQPDCKKCDLYNKDFEDCSLCLFPPYHWAFDIGTKPKRYINQFRTTRPDLDNLNKSIMDILTDLKFWNDDSQVAKLLLMKRWVRPEDAGILITINQIEGGEGITC